MLLFSSGLSSRPCLRSLALVLGLVLSGIGTAQAQREVQVDDDDTGIVYTPLESWYRNEDINPMDAGGYHMVTTDTTAQATFRFTGTGVQYMAPLWADVITTQVRLDGGIPVLIDLQDHTQSVITGGPTTVESSVLWSETGLENTEHTLVIDVAPGGAYAVLDRLVVLQADDDPATTDTTTSTTQTQTETSSSTASTTSSRTRLAAATSPTASPTPETRTGLSIAIGVVCGLVGLFLIAGALWFLRRRHQRKKERELWALNYQAQQQQQQQPQPRPDMTEIDDGITAPPKQRYRSIPSRNNLKNGGGLLYGDDGTAPDNVSQQSNGTTPSVSVSAKQTSKLRQVVVATEDGTRPGWSSAGGGGPGGTLYDPPLPPHPTNQYPRT